MKIFKCLILIFVIFLFNSNVYGLEKKDISLVAGDSVASVNTEVFNYNGVSLSKTDDKWSFTFQSITNNTDDKVPVSVNILLFDKNKVNIGFLAYCSKNDIDSDYSKFVLNGHESTYFSINIAKKYFITDKSLSDLSYYAILDENKYCHMGGNNKYEGLTFDEVNKGMVAANKNKSNKEIIREMYIKYSKNIDKVLLITIVLVVLIFFIRGIILNSLYIRMYYETSILSYLPIGSSYVTVKLAFGNGFAIFYILLYLISIPLSLIKVGIMILGFLSVFESISFIIDLVKLITGKYFLMGRSSKNEVEEEYNNNGNSKNEEKIILDDDSSDNDNIDISYSDDTNSGFTSNDSSEEGSDLTNMFK